MCKFFQERVFEEVVKKNLPDVPEDCFRLRDYDIFKRIPLQTYQGREDCLLEQLAFNNNKALYLETRKPGEAFAAENDITVKVIQAEEGNAHMHSLSLLLFAEFCFRKEFAGFGGGRCFDSIGMFSGNVPRDSVEEILN
jgi:hypothetical protein